MTSTTDTARHALAIRRPGAVALGGAMCAVGLALLVLVPDRIGGAFGLELLATAFWVWARSAPDRDTQIPRWAWLRRPAGAMWLASAVAAVRESTALPPRVSALLGGVEALAVLWAGLELLAALPLERPYSDRAGPLLTVGPWLPVLLPAAGFFVLWRHAPAWAPVAGIREPVLVLLVLTALLASLRAFGRGRWVASLRWLAVGDSALAAVLLARTALPREITLVLWVAACGGRAALLAGELRGASPRRRPSTWSLWRFTGWAASAALAWPVLVDLGFGRGGLWVRGLAVLVAFAAALASWVSVRRFVEAPDRRAMQRRQLTMPISLFTAIATLLTAAAGLALTWWSGFQARGLEPLFAAIPMLIGGGAAWWLSRPDTKLAAERAQVWGTRTRGIAQGLAGIVLALERWPVRGVAAIGRALLAPARDLHTGTAQEYLLFLVALGVLALVLPLLR
jgi:hypothetical protein